MPIYEYECDRCRKQFDLIQGFDASLEAPCQYCAGKARRLISPSAILFKGSGFHTTDYSQSKKTKSDKTTEASSSSGKTDSAKTEKQNEKSSSEKSPKNSEPAKSDSAKKIIDGKP